MGTIVDGSAPKIMKVREKKSEREIKRETEGWRIEKKEKAERLKKHGMNAVTKANRHGTWLQGKNNLPLQTQIKLGHKPFPMSQ